MTDRARVIEEAAQRELDAALPACVTNEQIDEAARRVVSTLLPLIEKHYRERLLSRSAVVAALEAAADHPDLVDLLEGDELAAFATALRAAWDEALGGDRGS